MHVGDPRQHHVPASSRLSVEARALGRDCDGRSWRQTLTRQRRRSIMTSQHLEAQTPSLTLCLSITQILTQPCLTPHLHRLCAAAAGWCDVLRRDISLAVLRRGSGLVLQPYDDVAVCEVEVGVRLRTRPRRHCQMRRESKKVRKTQHPRSENTGNSMFVPPYVHLIGCRITAGRTAASKFRSADTGGQPGVCCRNLHHCRGMCTRHLEPDLGRHALTCSTET